MQMLRLWQRVQNNQSTHHGRLHSSQMLLLLVNLHQPTNQPTGQSKLNSDWTEFPQRKGRTPGRENQHSADSQIDVQSVRRRGLQSSYNILLLRDTLGTSYMNTNGSGDTRSVGESWFFCSPILICAPPHHPVLILRYTRSTPPLPAAPPPKQPLFLVQFVCKTHFGMEKEGDGEIKLFCGGNLKINTDRRYTPTPPSAPSSQPIANTTTTIQTSSRPS